MSVKRYDKNFKIEVIRRVKEQGQKVPVLAKELGIHENTICKWIGEFKRDAENEFPGSGNLKPEDAEIRRLKRENQTLKEDLWLSENHECLARNGFQI
jgi:Transposase.